MADASAATVHRSAPADPALPPRRGLRTLQLRILSSLVLAPIAIGAVWFGWPWLPLLTAAAAAVMAWEWDRLCRTERSGTVALAAMRPRDSRLAAERPGSGRRSSGRGHRGGRGGDRDWHRAVRGWCGGSFSLSPGGSVMRSRLGSHRAPYGSRCPASCCCGWRSATDPGAPLCCGCSQSSGQPISALMRFGSRLGGPRLAPRWSPRKTWAGLLGGIFCAALAGWATARLLGESAVLPLVMLSAGLAIVGQFGDLAESAAKRRFGVKDSSDLIPGHGGLLDRLDGLLAVIPAVALLTLFAAAACCPGMTLAIERRRRRRRPLGSPIALLRRSRGLTAGRAASASSARPARSGAARSICCCATAMCSLSRR